MSITKRKEIIDFYKSKLEESFTELKVLNGIPFIDYIKDRNLIPCLAVSAGVGNINYQSCTAVNDMTITVLGFTKEENLKESIIEKIINTFEEYPYIENIDGLYNSVIENYMINTDEWYSLLLDEVIVFKVDITIKFYTKSVRR